MGERASESGSGSGGDRIELVPFLSNADPLNLGGASF